MKKLLYILLLSYPSYTCCNNQHTAEKSKKFPKTLEKQMAITNMQEPILPDTMYLWSKIKHADSLLITNNLDSVKILLLDVLSNSDIIHYPKGFTRAAITIGRIFSFRRQYDSSLKYYNWGLQFAQQLPLEDCAVEKILSYIGLDHMSRSQTDSALFYLYKAAHLLTQHKINTTGYSSAFTVYKGISVVWFSLDNFDKGWPFFDKATEIAMLYKDSSLIAEIQILQGSIHAQNHRLDSALIYYQAALKNKATKPDSRIVANSAMGWLYCKQQPQKAISNFEKALKICRQLYGNDTKREVPILFGLGSAYRNAGNQTNNIAYKNNALLIYNNIDTQDAKKSLGENILLLNRNIAILYADMKQYRKAYTQSMVAIAIRDSMYKKEKLSMMGKMDAQYRVAEKDKQLAQKQLQINEQENRLREKNLWIGITAGGTLLLSTFLWNVYRNNKRKKRLHEKQLQLLEQKRELDQLRAIMQGEEQERARLARELHDGIGGMIVLAKLNLTLVRNKGKDSYIDKIDDTIHLLDDTADEIRQTAHNLMPDTLQRHNLEEALITYCTNVNASGKLEIDIQTNGDLNQFNKSTELILYRIVQELVQNIVKHAEATHAIIQIIQDNNRLNLIVEDNGIGFDTSRATKGTGLKNLEFRVKALRGYISISSATGRSTAVYIEFDIQELKK